MSASKATFTKGPWALHLDPELPPQVFDAEGNVVCATFTEEVAYLIAAAPELVNLVEEYSRFVADEIEKAVKADDAERAYALGGAQFIINAALAKTEAQS